MGEKGGLYRGKGFAENDYGESNVLLYNHPHIVVPKNKHVALMRETDGFVYPFGSNIFGSTSQYSRAQQAYAKYMDSNKSVILQSAQAERERLKQEMNLAYQVYSQVATQLEGARIKEQEAKPVFVILEPAVIPNLKAGPSKAKMLVFFTFLAACGAATWVLFVTDTLAKIKKITSAK